jgi:hypothetical protein
LTSGIVGDIVRTNCGLTGAGAEAQASIHRVPRISGSQPSSLERSIPMNKSFFKPSSHSRIFMFLVATACVIIVLDSSSAQGQRRPATQSAAQDESSLFREYRGVQLGMIADDVRKKLGAPKEKGEEQDFFIFNDTETAQIVYDKMHKVITISADFMNPSTKVLSAKDVFGTELEAKADGSVYKMVRYPKAGYWISYNRTSGASPLTTVTLQKIQ